jgi:hypothetical protein
MRFDLSVHGVQLAPCFNMYVRCGRFFVEQSRTGRRSVLRLVSAAQRVDVVTRCGFTAAGASSG